MSFGRAVKRRVKSALPPLLLAGVAAYFGWSATQGDRGLQAYARQQEQLKIVKADLAKAEGDREAWERRVAGLRTNRLDPDSLDERSRAMLNIAEAADVVVMYGPGKKLF